MGKDASMRRGPLFALSSISPAWAQLGAASLNGPGLGISVDYLPASRYVRPEDGVKTKSKTAQVRYNFGAVFMLSNFADTITAKTRSWSLAASGSYSRLKNQDYDRHLFPEELLGAQVLLQHSRSIGKRWTIAGMLSLGLYTDLLKVDKNDVFINGGVLFMKQHSEKFSYGLGAVVTNSFGSPMVLPAFLLRWQTGGRYRLDIDFPEKISVTGRLSRNTDLALALRPRGGIYHVEQHPRDQPLMGYMEISAGLESTWHLGKQLDFVLAGGSILTSGVTFRRKKYRRSSRIKVCTAYPRIIFSVRDCGGISDKW